MKKTILLAAIATLAFASCDKENEFHQTYVANSFQIVYADQITDSVQYVTTEVHNLRSSEDWCAPITIYQESINQQIAANKGIYQLTAYLDLKLNTTGKLRSSSVTIDGGKYSANTLILQLGNLEVARPQVGLSSEFGTDSVSTLYIKDIASTDSIIFHTYYPWELSVPEGSFLTLEKTSGPAGRNVVRFTAAANIAEEARTEKISLTAICDPKKASTSQSAGEDVRITTIIPVQQAKYVQPTE